MKAGQGSKTAVMVCMGRALAHGRTPAPKFSDPTALTLLPPEARAEVERFRGSSPQRGLRARVRSEYLQGLESLMVGRTVAIDEAIRARSPVGQLVILGAGLDGRAWRMQELADAVVFEVDHPATQMEKRARTGSLHSHAREIRFVPVDFTRDSLEVALHQAGHDTGAPTCWVWEGVIPYLTPAEVEATLDVVARRSASGSRLVATYQRHSLARALVGWVVSRVGEPFRSGFTVEQMRALMDQRGLAVRSDDGLAALSALAGLDVSRLRFWMRGGRILVADQALKPLQTR